MAKKCEGRWRLTLVFDNNPGVKVPDGVVDIGKEDSHGVFKGKHTASNAQVRPLREGKCKDYKISFKRDHEGRGEIAYSDGAVGDDTLNDGRFIIVGGNFTGSSEGGESGAGGQDKRKDKEKDKKKFEGDTGTWTGIREGA